MTHTPSPLGAWIADDYEIVAEISDLMLTGVTVSDDERVFVSFPRWGDDVPYTVAEIIDGKAVAYPNAEVNLWNLGDSSDLLISVQSVIVDAKGSLWLLDTGAPEFSAFVANGPKLVEVDLTTNEIIRTIRLDPAAVTATTYLNDVRFDFTRGEAGYAYVTDSQPVGALIIIDLATGESWAKLRGHHTTKAEDGFRAIVQGVVREGYRVGADGIAISADGSRLFYCPLSSRRLYSVSTAALLDRSLSDDAVAETVLDHGDKGASDGLETDTDGAVYSTAYEHSAVMKRTADGTWSTIFHGAQILWPDTLSLASNGYLYLSANQLPRTPLFNGTDDRIPPYLVVRTHVGAKPIRLV
jgi:sugar lactone lactonase YvrE